MGGSDPGLPTLAAITMVRDEAFMLPRWIAHYAEQCGGPEHLYIVDDQSTDGSTEGLESSVLRIPGIRGDFEPRRMGLVSGLAAALLHVYDAVVFVDADEFLVADPVRYAGLRHFLTDHRDAPVVGAMALNVLHDAAHEPPLTPDRPALADRRLATFVPLMCKPAVRTRPVAWRAASHGADAAFDISRHLYLFHLKFADRDHLTAVSAHRRRLVAADGRGEHTNWSAGTDALVTLLDETVARAAGGAPPFEPDRRRLRRIVQRQGSGVHRATGRRQLEAMRHQPVVAIPERFAATVP